MELLGRLIFQPDIDVVNGMKYSFQSFQQTAIMFLAACTSTGFLQPDFGQNLCILLSLVQVWLAIPEQIVGLMIATVLHKKGTPTDPDLKISEIELMEQLRMDKVTASEKLKSGQKIAERLVEKILHLEKEGVYDFVVSIVHDTQFLLSLNVLNPGALNPFLQLVFCSEEVKTKLNELVVDLSPIELLFESLLSNRWVTSVDFQQGLDILNTMQDSLDSFLAVLRFISECNYKKAIETIIGSKAILQILSSRLKKDLNISNDGALTVLKQVFHADLIQKQVFATKNTAPELDKIMNSISNLAFDNENDLDTYCSVLDELRPWNIQNRHMLLPGDLLKDLDEKKSIEMLKSWKVYIPEPWQSVYIQLLSSAPTVVNTAQISFAYCEDMSKGGKISEKSNSTEVLPKESKYNSSFHRSANVSDRLLQNEVDTPYTGAQHSRSALIPRLKTRNTIFRNHLIDTAPRQNSKFFRSSAVWEEGSNEMNQLTQMATETTQAIQASLGFIGDKTFEILKHTEILKNSAGEQAQLDRATANLKQNFIESRHSQYQAEKCSPRQVSDVITFHHSNRGRENSTVLDTQSTARRSEVVPVVVPVLATKSAIRLSAFIPEERMDNESSTLNDSVFPYLQVPADRDIKPGSPQIQIDEGDVKPGSPQIQIEEDLSGPNLLHNLNSQILTTSAQKKGSDSFRQQMASTPNKVFIAEHFGQNAVVTEQSLSSPATRSEVMTYGFALDDQHQVLPEAFVAEFSKGVLEQAHKTDKAGMPFLEELMSMCLACSYDATLQDQEYAKTEHVTPAVAPVSSVSIQHTPISFWSFLMHAVRSIRPKKIRELLDALQDILPDSAKELLDPVFDIVDQAAEDVAREDTEASMNTENLQNYVHMAAWGMHHEPKTQESSVKSTAATQSTLAGSTDQLRSVNQVISHSSPSSRAAPTRPSAPNEANKVEFTTVACQILPDRHKIKLERGSLLVWIIGFGILIGCAFSIVLIGFMASSPYCGCDCLNSSTY